VQVEVAAIPGAYADAVAAIAAEAFTGVAEHQGVLLVVVVDDLLRHCGLCQDGARDGVELNQMRVI
jgi:hypothetical protein